MPYRSFSFEREPKKTKNEEESAWRLPGEEFSPTHMRHIDTDAAYVKLGHRIFHEGEDRSRYAENIYDSNYLGKTSAQQPVVDKSYTRRRTIPPLFDKVNETFGCSEAVRLHRQMGRIYLAAVVGVNIPLPRVNR